MLTVLLIACLVHQTLGHGGSYYPYTWNARNQPDRDSDSKDFKHNGQVPLPDERCKGPKCCIGIPGNWLYFTNYTRRGTPEPQLPVNMYDEGGYSSGWGKKNSERSPWSAPGSAKVFGQGCGAHGGNPNGCIPGNGNLFGTRCGKDCGSWEGGKTALEYAAMGVFDNAPVTEWKRGTNQWVYWKSGAQHRGGYAYRLCKVPAKGISGVTEECFQKGHLNFHGGSTWTYDHAVHKTYNINNWKKIKAQRTRKGTTPKNSQWAKVILPPEGYDKQYHEHNWAFKDKVKIPKNLAVGDYVLSFRWDCQNTHQVWNSCANVKIVN